VRYWICNEPQKMAGHNAIFLTGLRIIIIQAFPESITHFQLKTLQPESLNNSGCRVN
jgi:hypothetical protein